MVADEVSVAAAGAKGSKVLDLSPTAPLYLLDVAGLMRKTPDEVVWERYESTSSFTEAGWKQRSDRLKLGLMMWL